MVSGLVESVHALVQVVLKQHEVNHNETSHGSSEPEDERQLKIQKLQCRGVEFRIAKKTCNFERRISSEFCVTSLVIWFVVGVGSLQRNMGSSSTRTQIHMNVHISLFSAYNLK